MAGWEIVDSRCGLLIFLCKKNKNKSSVSLTYAANQVKIMINYLTVSDLRGWEGEQGAGCNVQSDSKWWGQYLRVCKCRHGSSGGVTLLDTFLNKGRATRACPVGDECQEEEKKRGKDFKSTRTPAMVNSKGLWNAIATRFLNMCPQENRYDKSHTMEREIWHVYTRT